MLRNDMIDQITQAADEIGPRAMLLALLAEMSNAQLARVLRAAHELSPTSALIAMAIEGLVGKGIEAAEAAEIASLVRQKVDIKAEMGEFLYQCFQVYNRRKLERQGALPGQTISTAKPTENR